MSATFQRALSVSAIVLVTGCLAIPDYGEVSDESRSWTVVRQVLDTPDPAYRVSLIERVLDLEEGAAEPAMEHAFDLFVTNVEGELLPITESLPVGIDVDVRTPGAAEDTVTMLLNDEGSLRVSDGEIEARVAEVGTLDGYVLGASLVRHIESLSGDGEPVRELRIDAAGTSISVQLEDRVTDAQVLAVTGARCHECSRKAYAGGEEWSDYCDAAGPQVVGATFSWGPAQVSSAGGDLSFGGSLQDGGGAQSCHDASNNLRTRLAWCLEHACPGPA